MAINEQIVTGRKFRKLIDEATKQWQRISFWTKASDVEFDDGNSAETKLGSINGITDSLTSTASNVAASAAAVKALNDKITELNSDLAKSFKIQFVASGGMYQTRNSNLIDVKKYKKMKVKGVQTAGSTIGLSARDYTTQGGWPNAGTCGAHKLALNVDIDISSWTVGIFTMFGSSGTTDPTTIYEVEFFL